MLVASGAVDPEEVVARAQKALGDRPAGERIDAHRPNGGGPSERFAYVEDDGSQTDVRIAFQIDVLGNTEYLDLEEF